MFHINKHVFVDQWLITGVKPKGWFTRTTQRRNDATTQRRNDATTQRRKHKRKHKRKKAYVWTGTTQA